jgi:hypothetical protein
MVIGSQKAATSKLRWYLSRHSAIDIPKEEAFHGGPNPVAAWDTSTNPMLLVSYLAAFEDVCSNHSSHRTHTLQDALSTASVTSSLPSSH